MPEQDDSSLPDDAREQQIRRYWRADMPWYSPSTVKWLLGLLDQARDNGDRLARLLGEGMGIVQSLAEDRALLLGLLDEYRLAHDQDRITRLRKWESGRCECALCAKVAEVHRRMWQVEQAEAAGSPLPGGDRSEDKGSGEGKEAGE